MALRKRHRLPFCLKNSVLTLFLREYRQFAEREFRDLCIKPMKRPSANVQWPTGGCAVGFKRENFGRAKDSKQYPMWRRHRYPAALLGKRPICILARSEISVRSRS